MTFETERLILRPWHEADAEELYELSRDPRVGPACGWNPHKSLDESRTVLKSILMNDYTYAIVSKDTGKLMGNISLMPPEDSCLAKTPQQAEIGFWLGHDYWGRGYMPEACRRLIEYGFNEKKLEEILCCHSKSNHNSARAQSKAGFSFLYADEEKDRIVNSIKRMNRE